MASFAHRTRRKTSTAYGIEVEGTRSRARQSKDVTVWERFLTKIGGGFLLFLYRRAVDGVSSLVSASWVLSLPFAILLMITSVDFLVLTAINDSANSLFFDQLGLNATDTRRDDVELLKTQVLQYVYILILCLSLVHWREIYSYFRQWPHLILLTACLLFGALISIEPIKVLTNASLIFIGFLSAILFAIAHAVHKNYRALYVAVFVPMVLLHLASLAIFTLYETDLIDFLFSSRRYGGLAGNPNSLGATAVLGFWAAGTLTLSRAVGWILRILAALSLPLFILHVLISGSGTSIAAMVIVTVVLFWLRILAAFKPGVRQALNAGAAVLMTLLLIAIVILTTPADLYLSFTESLGKDASLTGRTELWDVARDAISLRPYFGWGFDSHASVMAEGAFDIEFNHYHNGYLDTLVAGGALLLLVVLYNLGRFSRGFFVAFRNNSDVFPLVIPLIMLLFLNLSEYSLLRPNSQIWSIYVVAFVLLTFHQRDRLLGRMGLGRGRKTHRSRKRQLRWA